MAIDLNLLLRAYQHGVFPMADARDDPNAYWVEPKVRAIIPLDSLHISKSLAKAIRKDRFRVTSDAAFADVIRLCAEATPIRNETWINGDIEQAFCNLHADGMAHSVEVWDDREGQPRLVGGLYGLQIGRAFCGESMFSRATDASKVALVWLVARMRLGSFSLLDCQFMTDHLASLGAIEVSQDEYMARLGQALSAQFSTVASPSASPPESSSPVSSGSATAAGRVGDWGRLDGLLSDFVAAPSAVPGEDDTSVGSGSSPGNFILHSLTQTS